MPNLWECNFCKDMFIARDLFPCKKVAADNSIHHFLLCADCLRDFEETEAVGYVDEFEELGKFLDNIRSELVTT